MIWFKDDRGKSGSRAYKFLKSTDIDVEFINVKTGRRESIFIGTFQANRGRTKEFSSREEIIQEMKDMEQRKIERRKNGQQNYN